ncbi:4-(cytidine 5'-diphospho)-2-C-methyl-D-erythritol kinase [Aquabacter sp. L1I39]|uniref:4-(cytidine 5'-diphospho)-2-C-methyl-D-erythritol kinase n=1 Tax=Aquabacter sp. L1I39 TaxID=2820278 RepID=UPI001ADD00D5|nr:4-(cytidine 5'-diphospho)-2-C-methyl-D-erythritol kinase [Aquabacter sp. L1I39]QTL04842.1 4-(cytidine 5'-diphospho)-2-C-methyl-D-erythritol kinase [Aquabacter sp. L1I39]
MSKLVARAPAKVNLTLRVLRRRTDGFHDLSSLVAFAGVGDRLTLEPGGPLALTVEGPGAQAAGPVDDNLVIRAARALAERRPGLEFGHFALAKRLPVAAGLGGGSSDAAAALRLLAQANRLSPDDPVLMAAACAVGSDVPVCLDPRARLMEGVGDRLSPPLALPPLFAVLVNCRAVVPTPAVFRGLGLVSGEERAGPLHPDVFPAAAEGLIACLSGIGNDMEEAAEAIAPDIRHAKAALAEGPEARLVRMSGSGATVFALTDDCRAAARLARRVSARYPAWWVKATVLR